MPRAHTVTAGRACRAPADPERNYHIFYMVMVGAPKSCMGAALSSLGASDMRMLNQSKCMELAGRPDKEGYEAVASSMGVLGIELAQQEQLVAVLSALLLLGNVTFAQDDDDKASFRGETERFLTACEEMLQCGKLSTNLTCRKMARPARPPTSRRRRPPAQSPRRCSCGSRRSRGRR